MEKKIIIVTCSHGRLAEEIIRSAEMIIGPMAEAVSCCLVPGMAPDDYLQLVKEKLSPYKDASILVLADLFGGTPCNTLARLLKEYDMKIITGLNLGMLMETYSMRNCTSLQELKEIAMSTLKVSCIDVNERMGI